MTSHLLGQRLTDLQRQVCKDMGEATSIEKLRQLAGLGIPVLTGEPKTRPQPKNLDNRAHRVGRTGWQEGATL